MHKRINSIWVNCYIIYVILFIGETGVGTKTSLIQRIKEGRFIDIIEKHKEISENIIYKKDGKDNIIFNRY